MASRRIAVWSAAAPLDRGWTRARLERWCDEHGLKVDRYVDQGAWHIAIMQGAPLTDAAVKGPQCAAPGTPSVVLRWGLIDLKWWE